MAAVPNTLNSAGLYMLETGFHHRRISIAVNTSDFESEYPGSNPGSASLFGTSAQNLPGVCLSMVLAAIDSASSSMSTFGDESAMLIVAAHLQVSSSTESPASHAAF